VPFSEKCSYPVAQRMPRKYGRTRLGLLPGEWTTIISA
jgi:hypothetical protein